MVLDSTVLVFILLPTAALADLAFRHARNRFWKHIAEEKELLVDGVNHYPNIRQCLDELLTPEDKHLISTEQANRKIGLKHAEPLDGSVILVVIENAITPTHAKALTSLATCVRRLIPQAHEVRAMFKEFELSSDPGLGGNTPTHLAPLVGVFFPEVAQEMQRTLEFAYGAARWSHHTEENGYPPEEVLPDPKNIGFRACEFLSYKDFKEGLADHVDGTDTSYTFNYAFSGPEDYSGGYYYIRFGEDKKEKLFLKPNKYDALIFLGGRYEHGVTEITSGHRQMFSSELWDYPDVPFGSTLWSAYAKRMEEYVMQCDEEIAKGHKGPCSVNMTNVLIPEEGSEAAEKGDDGERQEEDTFEYREELSSESFVFIPKDIQKSLGSQIHKTGLAEVAFNFLYNKNKIGWKDGSTWVATMNGLRKSDMVTFTPIKQEHAERLFAILEEDSFRSFLEGIADAMGVHGGFVVEHYEVTAVSKFSDYDVSGKLRASISPTYKLVLPLRAPRSSWATFQTDEEQFDLNESEVIFLQPGQFLAPGSCNLEADKDFQMYLTIHLALDTTDLIPAEPVSLAPSMEITEHSNQQTKPRPSSTNPGTLQEWLTTESL